MLTPLCPQHNKPEFFNSPSAELGFLSMGFCNTGTAVSGTRRRQADFPEDISLSPTDPDDTGLTPSAKGEAQCLGPFLGVIRMGMSRVQGHHTSTRSCLTVIWAFPGGSVVKNPPANEGASGDPGSSSGSGRSPGGGHGNPLQVFLPGESHGQRTLAGYSPWACKESDMTAWLTQDSHLIPLHPAPSIFRGSRRLREEKWLYPSHRAS